MRHATVSQSVAHAFASACVCRVQLFLMVEPTAIKNHVPFTAAMATLLVIVELLAL